MSTGLKLGDTGELRLSGHGDLVYFRLLGAKISSLWRPARGVWFEVNTKYERPYFSADTIWAAFVPAPNYSSGLSAGIDRAGWQTYASVEGRQYTGHREDYRDGFVIGPQLDPGNAAIIGRFHLQRQFTDSRDVIDWASQVHWGIGGRSLTGSIGLRTPLRWPRPHRPLMLYNRIGASWYQDPARGTWDGITGWTLNQLEWRPSDGLSLGGQLESFSGSGRRGHLRALGTARLDNSW